MQRQEQKQIQQQQMTQDLVQRLPVLEADRLALAFRLARLARHNPNIHIGSGSIDWIADAASSFEEKLFTQIHEGSGSEDEKALRRQLVLMLDHRGLLPDTNEVLATRLGVDVTQIEQARQVLLFLEPTGIGSRTERECQYRHAIEHEDPRIVDVFEAIESGVSPQQMTTTLAISEEELARLERIVATLPKRPLLYEETGQVFPEVEVRYEEGTLVTTWLSPELDETRVGNDREAKWWMTSLSMRNETLREIWSIIEARQTKWLQGELVLNPLTRRTVTNYREELGFGNSRERERQVWKG